MQHSSAAPETATSTVAIQLNHWSLSQLYFAIIKQITHCNTVIYVIPTHTEISMYQIKTLMNHVQYKSGALSEIQATSCNLRHILHEASRSSIFKSFQCSSGCDESKLILSCVIFLLCALLFDSGLIIFHTGRKIQEVKHNTSHELNLQHKTGHTKPVKQNHDNCTCWLVFLPAAGPHRLHTGLKKPWHRE